MEEHMVIVTRMVFVQVIFWPIMSFSELTDLVVSHPLVTSYLDYYITFCIWLPDHSEITAGPECLYMNNYDCSMIM